MTGPTTAEVQQSERQRRSSSGSYEDEEPWDQRRRPQQQQQQVDSQYPSLDEEEGAGRSKLANNNNSMIRMKTRAADAAGTRRAVVKILEEEFDDGDLPSLSTSVNKSRAALDPYTTPARGDAVLGKSSGQPPTIKTTRALKTGSRSSKSAQQIDSMPSGERRKFWGQMEEDDDDDHPATSRQKNRTSAGDEVDGPDDEVAARRATGKPANNNNKKKSVADSEVPVQDGYDATDNESIPTEVESRGSEEELAEEADQYDASFCGQTLRALEDMCGTKLNLTNSGGDTKAQRVSKSPENAGTALVPRRPDTQQEHTAIEVEFVEPLAKKSSGVSKNANFTKDGTTSSDVSGKKNAYLNAMAKRAKENFRKKKKKDPGSGEYVDPASPLENGEGDALSVDREKVSAAGTVGAIAQKPSLSEAGSFDDDYNTFSPTEKRKFVKLINDGVSAMDATKKVKEERIAAKEQAYATPKEAARLPYWKQAQEHVQIRPSKSGGRDMYSVPGGAGDDDDDGGGGGGDENVKVEQDRELEVEATAATDMGGSLANEIAGSGSVKRDPERRDGDYPFQKSGINYYDAVRREQTIEDDSLDHVTAPKKPWHDPNKNHRKFSLPGKPKGFSALNDSINPPESKLAKIIAQPGDTQVPGLLLADSTVEKRMDEHASKEASVGIDMVSKRDMGVATIGVQEKEMNSRSIVLSPSEYQDKPSTAASPVEGRVADSVFASKSDGNKGKSTEPAVTHTEDVQQTAVSLVTSDDERTSPNVMDSLFRAPIRKKLAGYQKVGSAVAHPTLPEGPQENESDLVSKRSSSFVAPPDQEQPVASPTLNEDMEMYFGSDKNAAHSGSFGSPSISDNVSVYTVGTNVTGTSLYTTSSRVRRPGAAKTRLAKQKQIEEDIKKKWKGWHESIKAAAEATNRVWDPKKGWIDYIGHEDDSLAETNPEDKGKLRIDLSRSVISHKRMDNGGSGMVNSGEAVPIPFPKSWEIERKDMVGGPAGDRLDALSDAAEVSVTPSVTDKDVPELSGDARVEVDVDDPSLAGYTSVGGLSASGLDETQSNVDWVESMRAASAALASKGKTWDPVHGWRAIMEDGSLVPESVDYSAQVAADPSSLSATRAVETEPDLKIDPQIQSLPDAMPVRSDPAAQSQPESTSPKLIDHAAKMLRAETATAAVSASTATPAKPDQPAKLPIESTSKISPVLQARLKSLSQLGVDIAARASPMLQSPFKSQAHVSADTSTNAVPASPSFRNDVSTDSPRMTQIHPVTDSEIVPVVSSAPNIGDGDSADKNEALGLSPLPLVDTRTMQPLQFTDTASGYTIKDDIDTVSTGSALVIDANLGDFDKPMSPIVSVVKQKIGREDFNLFSEEGPRKNRSSPRSMAANHSGNEPALTIPSHEVGGSRDLHTRLVVAEETPRSNISIVSRDRSFASTSTRRGRSVGPIDVDQVDETWDSEGEDFERISNTGNLSVSRSILSGGSTASKPVPKLARSKRDTSPVHGERLSVMSSSETVRSQVTPVERRKSPRALRGPVPIAAFEGSEEKKETATFTTINKPHDPADNEVVHPLHPKTTDDENDRVSSQSMTGDDVVPPSPSVKERMQQWETRIETSSSYDAEEKNIPHFRSVPDGEKQPPVALAGWKSFLGKKVEAESAAAAAAGRTANSPQTTLEFTSDNKNADEDSLFVFKERQERTTESRGTQVDLNISDISPIQAKDDEKYDSEEMEEAESEAYGPTSDQRQVSSIFKRLSECAAPMMPSRMSPTAGGAGRFLPPGICGRPDADEPDSTASSAHSYTSADRHMRSASFGDDKPKSNIPTVSKTQRDLPVSNSSVVSEDFGAKTAYLEALAMKTAVSKPKRSTSARRERSAASSVVSSSTVHSERWRDFLERKKATESSSRASNSDVSRAAEKYASAKVDEIMSKMAARSKSVARSRDVHKEYNYVDAGDDFDDEAAQSKTTSVQAAQDLAAARVEAMMVALSNSQMEEAEI